jgi:hypothetical protein
MDKNRSCYFPMIASYIHSIRNNKRSGYKEFHFLNES